MTTLGEADRAGFETPMTVGRPVAYLAVDALGADGRTLGTSRTVTVPRASTGA
jgi:hypothetical protein